MYDLEHKLDQASFLRWRDFSNQFEDTERIHTFEEWAMDYAQELRYFNHIRELKPIGGPFPPLPSFLSTSERTVRNIRAAKKIGNGVERKEGSGGNGLKRNEAFLKSLEAKIKADPTASMRRLADEFDITDLLQDAALRQICWSLVSGPWLVLLRSEIEVLLEGGPQLPRVAFVDIETGKYTFQSFGITVQRGVFHSSREATESTLRARKREVRERVLEEIKLVRTLCHPYIIEFIEAFQGPTEIILVTEYLSGGELFERVADEDFDLTESECVGFMRQICEGVKYIHGASIVHLDLKPENIICVRKESNEVKIIDFGLARKLTPSSPVKVMCGTPEFVPPEVVNYDPISLAADLWSLGVIAYVLLSGLSPFMGENVTDTYSNISKAEYEFHEPEFDSITDEAKDFISAVLIKSPRNRMSAEKCLEHPWLTTKGKEEMKKKINTAKLRKFLARRRWQRCGQAIRAMKRMSGLMLKRRSTQSMDATIQEDPLEKSKSDGSSSEGEQGPHFLYSRVYTTTFTMEIT
eukprot:maker-scaffold200_size264178-snap-gene-1.18 protein:Tk07737 transcript:maker-scaffold200_size264178-snap-gene-1.18-mRNA-1 annotation:"myosin light chain kinase"